MPKKRKSKTSVKRAPSSAKRATRMTTKELDAAGEAYENSREGKAVRKPEPETRREQLARAFFRTPEMQECKDMAGTFNAQLDPGDTVSVTLAVPKQFMKMVEFLEKKRVAGSTTKPRSAKKVLNQMVLNELHEQLHFLVVQPMWFSYYRDLWNRYCDEQGAPEEKIVEERKPASKSDEEVPF